MEEEKANDTEGRKKIFIGNFKSVIQFALLPNFF